MPSTSVFIIRHIITLFTHTAGISGDAHFCQGQNLIPQPSGPVLHKWFCWPGPSFHLNRSPNRCINNYSSRSASTTWQVRPTSALVSLTAAWLKVLSESQEPAFSVHSPVNVLQLPDKPKFGFGTTSLNVGKWEILKVHCYKLSLKLRL